MKVNFNGREVDYDPRTSRHVIFEENGKYVARHVLQLRQARFVAFVAEQLRDFGKTEIKDLKVDPVKWNDQPGNIVEDIKMLANKQYPSYQSLGG